LDQQNHYVSWLIECQNFLQYCLLCLRILNNFDNPTKLFSNPYLAKFLNTSTNSFFSWYSNSLYVSFFIVIAYNFVFFARCNLLHIFHKRRHSLDYLKDNCTQFSNFKRTVEHSLRGKCSAERKFATMARKTAVTSAALWVRVLSVAPSGCTRFDDVYNFRQTSRSLAPTPPFPVLCLAICRAQTVVRNHAVIIRKAELTGDAGSLVSVPRWRRVTEIDR